MRYEIISADCHIDLPWMPEDLFAGGASAALRDRMPYVEERENGRYWVSRSGAQFGLKNGMGSAGRVYVPGQIHRSDRMEAQGLFSDGAKGIPRLADPELRMRDQDLDGVQAEVIYGILGASNRLNDDEAATEVMRIYNAWMADFCAAKPERFAGIASIPSHDVAIACDEVRRVAERGALRGIEVANTHDMTPLFDPSWEPLWALTEEADLPLHYHTIGSGRRYDLRAMPPLQQRQAFAVNITGFQLAMSKIIMEIIYGGVLRSASGVECRHRRKRHRVDSLHPGAHGPGVGRSIQGPHADHEAFRLLAPPVPCHLPVGPHRHSPDRHPGRRQRDVGQRLPAPRRRVAGFQGIHWARTRRRVRITAAQDHLRERRPPVPLLRLSFSRPRS